MEKLYVLIDVEPGELEYVYEEIKSREGIEEIDAVTGTFDIIVKIRSDSIASALKAVVKEIRKVKGIKNTETLVAVELG